MNDQILEKLERLEQELKRASSVQKEILDLKEACLYTGFSTSCMYKMTSQHRIPFSRPGGKRIFFRRTDLDQWMLSERQSSNNEIERQADNYIINNLKQKSNG
jgi:excisionase family DNA binding protein